MNAADYEQLAREIMQRHNLTLQQLGNRLLHAQCNGVPAERVELVDGLWQAVLRMEAAQ